MVNINNENHYCTVINVFTIEPSRQQELLDILIEATEKVMRHLPGYISANLHVSHDRKTITNYAQWASVDDFHNMLKNGDAQAHMKKAGALAIDFRPVTYDEIWSNEKYNES